MWLMHTTLERHLEKILEDGEIKPSIKTGISRYETSTPYVSMSVVFAEKVFKNFLHGPIIFFPIEIMDYYKVSHWSSNWLYGHYSTTDSEVSIKYNPRKSPIENTEIWKECFYNIHSDIRYKRFTDDGGAVQNEVVFTESIPIAPKVLSIIHLSSRRY